jgi:hypothetical protein
VEQQVPALTPYLELSDGRVLVASDCADEIRPAADGKGLDVVWRRWVVLKGKPAQFVDPGLTSVVHWALTGGVLTREETITALRPVTVHRLRVIFPSTSDHIATRFVEGRRIDVLDALEIEAKGPLTTSVRATANSALGRAISGPFRFSSNGRPIK